MLSLRPLLMQALLCSHNKLCSGRIDLRQTAQRRGLLPLKVLLQMPRTTEHLPALCKRPAGVHYPAAQCLHPACLPACLPEHMHDRSSP